MSRDMNNLDGSHNPLLVPILVHPSEAGSWALPLEWQQEVVASYVSRRQPESLYAFAKACHGVARGEKVPWGHILPKVAEAYGSSERSQDAYTSFTESPYDHRSARYTEEVVRALALDGRVEDIQKGFLARDLPQMKGRPTSHLRAHLVTAHTRGGDFEAALALARDAAVSRAQVVSGLITPAQATTSGGDAPIPTSLFNALIAAAGEAGAPHYARTVFEVLVQQDLGHSFSMGVPMAQAPSVVGHGISTGESAAAAVMVTAQGAIKDELVAMREYWGEGGGGGGEGGGDATSSYRPTPSNIQSAFLPHPPSPGSMPSLSPSLAALTNSASARFSASTPFSSSASSASKPRFTLFTALYFLREAGEAAPNLDTYLSLLSAYASSGDTLQARVVWGMLKARCTLEAGRRGGLPSSPGGGGGGGGGDWAMGGNPDWVIPASAYESYLSAFVEHSSRAVEAHARAVSSRPLYLSGGGGRVGEAPFTPSASSRGGGIPSIPTLLPFDKSFFDLILTDMDKRVRPGGRSGGAVGAVAALYVLRGDTDGALALRDAHEDGPLRGHWCVSAAILSALSTLATASTTRGAPHELNSHLIAAKALWASTAHFNPSGASVPTGGFCSSALAAFAACGAISECEGVIRYMRERGIEVRHRDFSTVLQAFLPSSDARRTAELGRTLYSLDKAKARFRGSAPAFLALAECMVGNAPYGADLLADTLKLTHRAPMATLFKAIAVIARASATQGTRFKDSTPTHATVHQLLSESLCGAIGGEAFRLLSGAYDKTSSPGGLRAYEALTARVVHEAVVASGSLMRGGGAEAARIAAAAAATSSSSSAFPSSLEDGEAVGGTAPTYETSIRSSLVGAMKNALLAFGALIATAPNADTAVQLFHAATSFERDNVSLFRMARAELGEELSVDFVPAAPAPLRRSILCAHLEAFQAHYAGLLSFALTAPATTPPLYLPLVCEKSRGSPATYSLLTFSDALQHQHQHQQQYPHQQCDTPIPCGAGAATFGAWASLCDANCVVVTPSTLEVGLRGALVGGGALEAIETEAIPKLLACGVVGLGGGSPLGHLLPRHLWRVATDDWLPSLLYSDSVISLRLGLAGGIRGGGGLTLSLWSFYLADKEVMRVKVGGSGEGGMGGQGGANFSSSSSSSSSSISSSSFSAPFAIYSDSVGSSFTGAVVGTEGTEKGLGSSLSRGGDPSSSIFFPFSSTPPTAALSSYLASLATHCASAGSSEHADAIGDTFTPPPPSHLAAHYARPLSASIALSQGRLALQSMADGGGIPTLGDAASIIRLYAAAGLMPEARLLCRMILAPALRRDYTRDTLERDSEGDSKSLRESLGGGGYYASTATPPTPWEEWPGQGALNALGVSSAGLGFAAPHPGDLTDPGLKAVVTSLARGLAGGVGKGGLPLTSHSFASLALCLGATGLAHQLLPFLIESAREQEDEESTRRGGGGQFTILDSTAAIATYGAWALEGDVGRAEAVLSDSRFHCGSGPGGVWSGSASGGGSGGDPAWCADLDASLSHFLGFPSYYAPSLGSRGSPPFYNPTPLLSLHGRFGPTASIFPAILVNSLRIQGAFAAGETHKGLRLMEGAMEMTPTLLPSIPPLTPSVLSHAIAAVLHCPPKELTASPPSDTASRVTNTPYESARKLLQGGAGASSSSTTLVTLAPWESPSTSSLLTILEGVAGAFTRENESVGGGVRHWTPSPADVGGIVRLYARVGSVDTAAAVGWNYLHSALQRRRDELVSELERSGMHGREGLGGLWGEASSPVVFTPTTNLLPAASPSLAQSLEDVEQLLREALYLCGSHTGTLPPLAPSSSSSTTSGPKSVGERPRPLTSDTCADVSRVCTTWGLPCALSTSHSHPRPGGEDAPYRRTLALPSLMEALATLYATAPPLFFGDRRIVEHSVRTLITVAYTLGVPITPSCRSLYATGLYRCRGVGSFPVEGLEGGALSGESLVEAASVRPCPPHSWIFATLTPTLLCADLPLAPSPPEFVWCGGGGGGGIVTRGRSATSHTRPPPTHTSHPGVRLSPTMLLTLLASTGYPLLRHTDGGGGSGTAAVSTYLGGSSGGGGGGGGGRAFTYKPVEDSLEGRLALALVAAARSAHKEKPLGHTPHLVSNLYIATYKALCPASLPAAPTPPLATPAPPPDSTGAALLALLNTVPTRPTLPLAGVQSLTKVVPPPPPNLPAYPLLGDASANVRTLENEVMELQAELKALESSIADCEDKLIREQREGPVRSGRVSSLISMPSAPACTWPGATRTSLPLQLSDILQVTQQVARTLEDSVALKPTARELLSRWMTLEATMERDLEEARAAHASEFRAVAALETRFKEAQSTYDSCIQSGKAYTYSAAARAALASQAAALEPIVLGPTAVLLMGVQSVKELSDNRAAADARAREFQGRMTSAAWAGEAYEVKYREEVQAMRERVTSLESRLHSHLNALPNEEPLAHAVRELKGKVTVATMGSVLGASAAGAGGAGPWVDSKLKLVSVRAAATAATARLELNRRVLQAGRLEVAVDEERAAGSRALTALRESLAVEREELAAEYASKCREAERALRAALTKECAPMKIAAEGKARDAEVRLSQLRTEVSFVECELASVLDGNGALLGLGSAGEYHKRLVGDIMGEVEEAIALGSEKDCTKFTLSFLEQFVPIAMSDLVAGTPSLLKLFNEHTSSHHHNGRDNSVPLHNS